MAGLEDSLLNLWSGAAGVPEARLAEGLLLVLGCELMADGVPIAAI